MYVKAVFPPYTGKAAYTYRSDTDSIEVGQYAVVDTPSNGYQVVKIVEVLDTVDLDVPYEYKSLLEVLDL